MLSLLWNKKDKVYKLQMEKVRSVNNEWTTQKIEMGYVGRQSSIGTRLQQDHTKTIFHYPKNNIFLLNLLYHNNII